MKKQRTSRVLLFGKLRSFSPRGELHVTTTADMTPQQLREVVAGELATLSQNFTGVQELNSSAVVQGERVLTERDNLGDGTEFALLPPVCGG